MFQLRRPEGWPEKGQDTKGKTQIAPATANLKSRSDVHSNQESQILYE